MMSEEKHYKSDQFEDKFRLMVENANDAIFLIDPENAKILYANIKAQEFCQRNKDQLCQRSIGDLHPTDEQTEVKQLLEKVKKESSASHNELHLIRPNNSTLVVEVSSIMISYSGKNVIQQIYHDITNRKKLIEANERILETFKFVMDMMPVGFGVRSNLKDNPIVEFENKQLKLMFHKDGDDHTHKHWEMFGRCDSSSSVNVLDENGLYVEEHQLEDGRILQFTITYIRDMYNSWRELQIVRDVTKRRQLEQDLISAKENLEEKVRERTRELQEKQVQLIQSEKMASLGNLVAGVAHEINTPIGALSSNNDLFIRYINKMKAILESDLKDKQILDQLQKLFENIDKLNSVNRTASDRIINIVRSLKNFARIDQAEKDTVDLHEGLDTTLTLIHHEVKNRIKINKEYGLTQKVHCFPNQINQVFMNILVNASQAIEKEGTITIKTYSENSYAVIEISDNGEGIPEDKLGKIFDPGFTTKGVGVGTGLGLSIVHQIIENHRGSISVNSRVNQGTSFKIMLPIN